MRPQNTLLTVNVALAEPAVIPTMAVLWPAAIRGCHTLHTGSGENDAQWTMMEGEKVQFLLQLTLPYSFSYPNQPSIMIFLPSFLPACLLLGTPVSHSASRVQQM